MNREELIEYAILHFKDLIPYNTPDYHEKIRKVAEIFADYELNNGN